MPSLHSIASPGTSTTPLTGLSLDTLEQVSFPPQCLSPGKKPSNSKSTQAGRDSRASTSKRNAPAVDFDCEDPEEVEEQFQPGAETSTLWQVDSSNRDASLPEPERQVLSHRLKFVLAMISETCDDLLRSPMDIIGRSNTFKLLHKITGKENHSKLDMMEIDSLENLALRCSRADSIIAAAEFVYMVNCIQFRNKIIS